MTEEQTAFAPEVVAAVQQGFGEEFGATDTVVRNKRGGGRR